MDQPPSPHPYPQQPPPQQTSPEPPQQRRPKRWGWIVGIIAAFVFGIGIGSTAADVDDSADSPNDTSTEPADEPEPADSENEEDEVVDDGEEEVVDDGEDSEEAEEASEAATPPEPESDTITYTVETTGPGIETVTYSKPNFDISQESDVSGTSWSVDVELDGQSTMGMNMNAQNSGGGEITCTIERDGETLAENSSSGEFAMVTCSL